jgi:hypothetical protein
VEAPPSQLLGLLGLTPGERTSDAHTRRGHITKQGSRWLRWTLVEAATSAVRDADLARLPARSPSARASRSPGWRWSGGCSPCATTPCAMTVATVPTPPQHGSRRPAKGALGVCHGLAAQRPPARLSRPAARHHGRSPPE